MDAGKVPQLAVQPESEVMNQSRVEYYTDASMKWRWRVWSQYGNLMKTSKEGFETQLEAQKDFEKNGPMISTYKRTWNPK